MLPESICSFINSQKTIEEIFYQPCSSSIEILRNSLLPYLCIKGIEVPHAAMLEEAKRLIPAMIPHRVGYEGHRGWKNLCLHGISSAHTENADKYGMDPQDPTIYQWTDVAKLAPVTTDFFQNKLHYKHFHRVRFMLLEPGGYIAPHTDHETYRLGPLNIALNNPEGCLFAMEKGGIVPFEAGTINKMALINKHCVYNNSSEPRIHIIVHGVPDDKFWDSIILNSFERMINEESHSRFLAI